MSSIISHVFHNGILLLLVKNLRTAPPRLLIKLIAVATSVANWYVHTKFIYEKFGMHLVHFFQRV